MTRNRPTPGRQGLPPRRGPLGVRRAGRQGTCLAALALAAVLAAGLWGVSLLAAQEEEGSEITPAQAVEAGREALQGRTYYPWYDPQADAARRVEVAPPKKPPPPSNPNWKWPEWKGWNMDWSLGDIFWKSLEVLFWLVIVGLLVWLIFLLTRVFLGRESSGAIGADESQHIEAGATADRIEHLPFEVRRPQGDLLGEARRLYEQGQYGEAVIYYFSYLLLELDRRQVIRLTRGKTNRQYLREVRRHRQDVAGLVERTMVAFEDVFFGDHALERERFESCWNELEDFQKQLQPQA